MTTKEFNIKYGDYLVKNYYGLDIDIPIITEYLDKVFEELIKIPDFKYHQIKLKFDMARVYLEPREIDTNKIEEEINKLYKTHLNG